MINLCVVMPGTCKVGRAEEHGHESNDEDEEGVRNHGMDAWPVA